MQPSDTNSTIVMIQSPLYHMRNKFIYIYICKLHNTSKDIVNKIVMVSTLWDAHTYTNTVTQKHNGILDWYTGISNGANPLTLTSHYVIICDIINNMINDKISCMPFPDILRDIFFFIFSEQLNHKIRHMACTTMIYSNCPLQNLIICTTINLSFWQHDASTIAVV